MRLLNFFTLLFGIRKTRRRRSHISGFSCLIEGLGLRVLPTVTFASGLLSIATQEPTVIVGADVSGKVTVDNEVTEILARDVTTIRIDDGNPDGATINLSTITRSAFSILISTTVNTGVGNDTVVTSSAVGDYTINGDAGDDRFEMTSQGGWTNLSDSGLWMDGPCRHIRFSSVEIVAVNAANSTRELSLYATRFTGRIEATGSPLNDKIYTGRGDDFLIGNGGSDDLNTGDGDNLVVDDVLDQTTTPGGFGSDTIVAGNGDDVIYISGGLNNRIDVGAGNDLVDASVSLVETSIWIQDGTGNGIYYGSSGNDTFRGAGGYDLVFGGNGNDSINYSEVVLGSLIAHGDDGDDTIMGSLGDDIIYGGDGEDTILGGGGDDLIFD